MSTVTRFQISEIHSAFVRRKILSDQAGPGAVPPGDEPVDLSPGVAAGVEEWLAGVGLPDVGPALEAEAAPLCYHTATTDDKRSVGSRSWEKDQK